MRTFRTSGLREAVAAMVVLVGCVTGAAAFNPDKLLTESAFGVLGYGAVYTVVHHGDVTYLGGTFDELAAITGALARLDTSTARRVAPLAEVSGGEVRAVAADGKGGFYVGGTFTHLGGRSRAGLGHILANGRVNANFIVNVRGASGAVNAVVISGDGRTLYVGGQFERIGGQPRNNLAAIDLGTSEVTSFDPAGLGTDDPVFALEVSGTHVYVGGRFEKLGGQTRNGLAKVQGTTGGDLGWVPNPTFGNGAGWIRAIEALDNSVYVGGVFTNIGGRARSNLARLTATAGNAIAAFAPNPDDTVFTLLLAGQALYVGGDFATIAGQSRPALARMDMFTGNIAPFNVDARTTDRVRALAVSGTDLYVGGVFPDLGNPVARSSNLVKVNASTGAGNQAFAPGLGDEDGTVSVNALAVDGTSL